MPEHQTNADRRVALQEQIATVKTWLEDPRVLAEWRKAMPAKTMAPERLARIVFTEVRRTPRLAECTYESMMGAVMTCAQFGLEPGQTGFCFLIPRRNSRNNNAMEVNWQVGYKGLVQLGWRSPKIAGLQAAIVHEGDDFDYMDGSEPWVRHKPADEPDKEWTHGWVSIRTTSGGNIIKVMPKAKILEVRDRYSESWKNQRARAYSPWTTHEEEMALKTVLIRAYKLAPISYELAYAITLDDKATAGIDQELQADAPGFPEDPEGDAIDAVWDSVEADAEATMREQDGGAEDSA